MQRHVVAPEDVAGPRPARILLETYERQPAAYSFAHGGKDGHPYPVDRATYDATVTFLEGAVRRARIVDSERFDALRRLAAVHAPGR